MAKRKSTAHYVDNKVFLQAMKEWKEKCEEAEQMGEEKPRVSNYIGEVRTELKRVNWPSTQILSTFTIVTIVTIITMTLLIFGMDFGFKNTLISMLSLGE